MLNRNTLFVKAGVSLGVALAFVGTATAQESDAPAEAQAPAATQTEADPLADTVVAGTIADTIRSSAQYSTLAAGMEATGLIERLAGPGPFTVFAPTDAAFSQAMSPGDIEALMGDAARPMLEGMMGYYVVPGEYEIAGLMERAEANGGSMTLETVSGSPLTLSIEGPAGQRAVKLTGDVGAGYVTDFDLERSNGMIHVLNGVLIPNTQTPDGAADAE